MESNKTAKLLEISTLLEQITVNDLSSWKQTLCEEYGVTQKSLHEPFAKNEYFARNWAINGNSGNHIYKRFINNIYIYTHYTCIIVLYSEGQS